MAPEDLAGAPSGAANEAAAHCYEAENRHFARAFLGRERPRLTFDDGLEVVRVLMAADASAEQARTLEFPPDGLDDFVPAVARGDWRPRGPGALVRCGLNRRFSRMHADRSRT